MIKKALIFSTGEAIRSGRMSKDDLKLSNQDFSVGVPVQISVYKDKLYISNDCVFPEDWTADTLMQKHRSLPHNPDIAYTFYRAGFIESWGCGIEKICTLCKEYGIPEPEYTLHRNDIMMLFKTRVPVNVPVNQRQKQILLIIKENPRITALQLSQKLVVTDKTIKRDLQYLKVNKIIEHVGPDKTGHWEVKE